MAAGPGFKKSKIIKPFKNIELYNVMAGTVMTILNANILYYCITCLQILV